MTTILRPIPLIVLSAMVLWVWMLCAGVAQAYTIEQIPGGDGGAGDFVVGPTKTDLTLQPGTQQVVEIMVTNRMGQRRVFNLTTEDMKGSDNPEQTVVLLGDDRGPYSLKDYLKFPEMSFELNSGERARIPVTVSVPKDAQPGGLYGSVLVSTTSVPPKEGDAEVKTGAKTGSVIQSRIGLLFFITVPGAVTKEGSLKKFSMLPEGRRVLSKGPIQFQLLFKNSGSIHLNPYGTVSIKNILGEEVGTINVDPWFSLPQSTRLRELTWDRPYLFGRYTAEAHINRGYDNQSDTATVSFWVIPWTLLGAAFLGLLLVFFILRFIARTFEIKKK